MWTRGVTRSTAITAGCQSVRSPHLAFPFAESLRTRHAVGRGSGGARTLSEPQRGDDTRSRARTFLATLSV